MFEREYREMSVVPRWTIIRTIQKQNVAEHSYYVTLYAGQIADLIKWTGPREKLLDYGLRHDLEETYMSDIPGPSKRAVVTDRNHYDRHCREKNLRRFGDDYGERKHYPVASSDWGCSFQLGMEIKAIIKVADLLDECFFLSIDQQLGNESVQNVFVASHVRLHQAVTELPCDVDTQTRIRDVIEKAILAHRHNQSILPIG